MRGLLKRSGKRTVCGMVSSRNQKPPSWEKARVATALYHAEAFVCLLKSAPSRIMRARRLYSVAAFERHTLYDLFLYESLRHGRCPNTSPLATRLGCSERKLNPCATLCNGFRGKRPQSGSYDSRMKKPTPIFRGRLRSTISVPSFADLWMSAPNSHRYRGVP